MMDQLDVKGLFWFFRSQMWEDKAVLVDLSACLKVDLWAAKRVLNVLAVRPMYSFGPSPELTVFLYTTLLVRHLPSRGQS